MKNSYALEDLRKMFCVVDDYLRWLEFDTKEVNEKWFELLKKEGYCSETEVSNFEILCLFKEQFFLKKHENLDSLYSAVYEAIFDDNNQRKGNVPLASFIDFLLYEAYYQNKSEKLKAISAEDLFDPSVETKNKVKVWKDFFDEISPTFNWSQFEDNRNIEDVFYLYPSLKYPFMEFYSQLDDNPLFKLIRSSPEFFYMLEQLVCEEEFEGMRL